jgi:hypothetical protein
MSFREIDDARRTAASLASQKSRGKKRKGGSGSEPADDIGGYIADRRTGRWTNEEMIYCDKLISSFERGSVPLADGIKLNEFLGNMLKSKQSRLTKKMKNAKLSTKVFKRQNEGLDTAEAREFSELEESFFQGIQDLQERAEMKFHMQKEWREQFSQVCAAIGQSLDADAWLSSVEEMDRRASQAKDAARMSKRKLMMGVALKTDSQNLERGVFIERTDAETRITGDSGIVGDVDEELMNMFNDEKPSSFASLDYNGKSSSLHSAPFLSKVIAYLQRHAVPFEHVDLWVPSFVEQPTGETTCRLCYAGSATVDRMICADTTSREMNADEKFNLCAFGDYSQKFSFDVGCGLPGRVYESGRATWEQSVHNAPHSHFERCGGAKQWGIQSVLGLPIASPNVGRIVVTLYSCVDRPKDEDLVTRLSDEFTRVSFCKAFFVSLLLLHSLTFLLVVLQLMPSPKWKLVVDIGDVEEVSAPVAASSLASQGMQAGHFSTTSHADFKDASEFAILASDPIEAPESVTSRGLEVTTLNRDSRIGEVASLLAQFMPSDPHSSAANYQSGFMSLRLLLLRGLRSAEEDELVRTILESYTSYVDSDRERSDIAIMLARDYIFLSQQMQQTFFGIGQGMMAPISTINSGDNSGLSLFGLPSTSSSLQNSPALTPIPAPGLIDSLSIVSN